jgi:hypothetical protein
MIGRRGIRRWGIRVALAILGTGSGAVPGSGIPAWAGIDVVRGYEVLYTQMPPTMDGTISPDEWETAPRARGWGLLGRPAGTVDQENSSFRALWDDEALYLLLESDFDQWDASPAAAPAIDFADNSWNLFWDPNLDGDPNFPENIDPLTTPVGNQDNYQVAFSAFAGESVMQGTDVAGNWLLTEARYQNNFGNNTTWRSGVVGLRGLVIAQSNGLDGGVAEVRVPWTEFDAPAELVLNSGVVQTGLHHPFAPSDGDTWFFQAGRISTDPANAAPVWNWQPGTFFAEHPHGEITFVTVLAPQGIPGDYNDNGQVEQGDLDLVLLNWGQNAVPPPQAWANELPEGLIDQAELDGVLLNWGNTAAGLVGSPAVPEPAAWLSAVLSLFAVAVCRVSRCVFMRSQALPGNALSRRIASREQLATQSLVTRASFKTVR